jgi:hypothetical protein
MTGTINKENTSAEQKRLFYGPLLLGYQGPETIPLKEGDLPKIRLTDEKSYRVGNINIQRPLIFEIEGTEYRLSPLYHAMSPEVKDELYHKQFLFEADPGFVGRKEVEIRKRLW